MTTMSYMKASITAIHLLMAVVGMASTAGNGGPNLFTQLRLTLMTQTTSGRRIVATTLNSSASSQLVMNATLLETTWKATLTN
jgi:hypothetical protein